MEAIGSRRKARGRKPDGRQFSKICNFVPFASHLCEDADSLKAGQLPGISTSDAQRSTGMTVAVYFPKDVDLK